MELQITPRKPIDKKKAKMMEDIINWQYEEHNKFVEALVGTRVLIEQMYGIKTPDEIWNAPLEAYLWKVEWNEM